MQLPANDNTVEQRNDKLKIGPIAPGDKRVVNLMSGKEIDIAKDTPYACDPSMERYWTM